MQQTAGRQQAAGRQAACTNGILSSTDSRVYGATRGQGQLLLGPHIKFHFAQPPSWNRTRLMKVKQLLMSTLPPLPAILQTIKCFAWQYAICFDMDIMCFVCFVCFSSSLRTAKSFLIICEKVIKRCACVCV